MLGWLWLLAILLGAAPTTAGHDEHVFAVPYRSQLDGSRYALANCGPASLAMALAYYGVDVSAWDLRVRSMKAQHSWVTDEGGYSDSYGVFVYNLAAAAESLGVHTSGLWLRDGWRLDRLHPWRPDEIRREIQADRPVILQVAYRALPDHRGARTLEDHYIVVHGVRGDAFVYADPLGTDGEDAAGRTIDESDLRYAMAAAAAPRAGFALTRSATVTTATDGGAGG